MKLRAAFTIQGGALRLWQGDFALLWHSLGWQAAIDEGLATVEDYEADSRGELGEPPIWERMP